MNNAIALRTTLEGFRTLERGRVRLEELSNTAFNDGDTATYKALGVAIDAIGDGFSQQAKHLAAILGVSVEKAIVISNDFLAGDISEKEIMETQQL